MQPSMRHMTTQTTDAWFTEELSDHVEMMAASFDLAFSSNPIE
jgi:hypothetical protein